VVTNATGNTQNALYGRSGDLRRDHKALEIGCLNSDRYEYVDANSVKLPDDYRKTGKNDPEQISIVRHKGMI
jgi:hypothetical protein